MAHLIGFVAKGDLRNLVSLNALFQSMGFVLLAVDAVFALEPLRRAICSGRFASFSVHLSTP